MDKRNTRENLVLNDKIKFDNKGGSILGVLEGPVADFIHPTRNGRLYGEQLWENVQHNEIVKEQIANGGILGELDHPKDRDDICTEKVAIRMAELPVKKEDGKYYGKFDILDTPCGRIVYTLAKAGFKLGVSSRGNGDYDEYTGEVDPDSYDFVCFDVVTLPAVKEARMNLVTESLEENSKIKKFKKLLNEQLSKESEENKRLMEDTVRNVFKTKKEMEENLDNPQEQTNFKKEHPEWSKEFDFNKFGKYFDKDGKLVDEKGYTKALGELGEQGKPIQEALEHHKCIICGNEFDGYGNNAEPVKQGICCDKCNQEKVIPARLKKTNLKEDKEIPNISVEDDTLTVDIDKPEVDETEIKEEPCEECKEFDNKLKDFLVKFLETQELETEGEEEKDLFVKLFHETFPKLDCCAEKRDDIEEVDDEPKKDLAADVDGADGYDVSLLEQLQKALKENKKLKENLRELQSEKAVGNSKVSKLQEELERFKNIAALAGKKALSIKSYESENVKLNEKVKSLNENLSKVSKESSENLSLKNQVQESLDIETKENKELKEKLNNITLTSKKLEEKYQKSIKLVEQYKKFAHEIANRYIDSKALALGVNPNEIKNRLNESYTLDDVDKVCEELQDYSINMSKLPFQLDKPGSVRARLREDKSSDPLRNIRRNDDDEVDDFLLELAGLRK